MNKPNCYNCIHRRDLPGDAHSMCVHPDLGHKDPTPFGVMESMVLQMISGTMAGAKTMGIRANLHGVRSGWFYWPANFDPVWLENCDGFTEKK